MQLLKNVPNLQVVYIDNGQVNDAAVAPLKDLPGLSALTIMSPQVTDAGAREPQGPERPDDAVPDQLEGRRQGPAQPQGPQEPPGPGPQPTQVTDAGLDALKDIKSLKSVYLIGTKVTPQAVEKLKQAMPGVAVYK